MIRSTTPSCVASSASSSRPPPATSEIAPSGSAGRRRRPRRRSRASTAFECAAVRRAAQHDRVAGLQAQRGGVDRDVRPRLVDDRDDAERHAHLAHVEPVGQPVAVDHLADRVGQRRDRARAVGDRRDPRRASSASRSSSASPMLVRAAGLQVARVGLEDLRRARASARRRSRRSARVLDARVERGERARRPRFAAAQVSATEWSRRRSASGGAVSGTAAGDHVVASGPLRQHEVVAVDASSVARGSSSRTSADFMPLHAPQLRRGVVADALADRRAPSCTTSTASPASKPPLDLDDADRQQARAALAQRARGAGVDDDRAARGLGVLQPQLEARVARLAAAAKRVPDAARRRRAAASAPGVRARCRSRPGCRPRSPSRRRRPSSACRRSRAATSSWPMSSASSAAKSVDLGDERRRRVDARVGRVEPVGVGQQHQQLGAEQDRDLRGEEVVVAEGDLVGRGRVVLVDRPGRRASRAACAASGAR